MAEPSRRGDIIRALDKALRLSIDAAAWDWFSRAGPHSHVAYELPRSVTASLLLAILVLCVSRIRRKSPGRHYPHCEQMIFGWESRE